MLTRDVRQQILVGEALFMSAFEFVKVHWSSLFVDRQIGLGVVFTVYKVFHGGLCKIFSEHFFILIDQFIRFIHVEVLVWQERQAVFLIGQ